MSNTNAEMRSLVYGLVVGLILGLIVGGVGGLYVGDAVVRQDAINHKVGMWTTTNRIEKVGAWVWTGENK